MKKVEYMVQETGKEFYEVGKKVFLLNVSGGKKILRRWNYRQKNW